MTLLTAISLLAALGVCAGCTDQESASQVSTATSVPHHLPLIGRPISGRFTELAWRLESRSGDRVKVVVSFGCTGPPTAAWVETDEERVVLHVVAPQVSMGVPCAADLTVGLFSIDLPAGYGSHLAT